MSDIFDGLLSRVQTQEITDPESAWREIAKTAGEAKLSFPQCRQLWNEVFREWPAAGPPAPMWSPSETEIGKSNIFSFCQRQSLSDYPALHRWSIDFRAEFWEATIEQLGIRFATKPQQILQMDNGVASARWLVGAQMNIVDSCLSSDEPSEVANSPAIIWSDSKNAIHTWSRRQLLGKIQRVSRALQVAGLAGQAIAMLTPMTPWSVVVYLAVIHSGGTVVSIADSFSAPEIRRRLDIVDCQTVFTCDWMLRAGRKIPLLQRVHQASELGTAIRSIVMHGGDEQQIKLPPEDMRSDDLALVDLLEVAGPEDSTSSPKNIKAVSSIVGSADDPINILFSSGTTGDPKAIVWDHTTPIKCAADGWFHQDIHTGDVVAWPTNLGWMMGPWLIYASLINKAAMALYHDAPTGVGFGNFVQESSVTMLGLVPSMVKAWRATGDMETLDWSAIRVFSSTGESSNADDYFYLSWLADFKPVIEYCGGTEIGGGYVTSTVVQPNAPATFSTAALGLDLRIIGEDNQQTDEGELYLVPPSIGLSTRLLNRDHDETYYANVPQLEGVPLRRHGDHFRSLPGGYFEAGGRADDTMNLGGIKVSSIEIEKAINQLSDVLESAAVAVEDTGGGPSQLVLFLVVEPSSASSIGDQTPDLLSRCNKILKQELNPLFRATKVQIIEKLPRTASNKIMRRLLRDSLQ